MSTPPQYPTDLSDAQWHLLRPLLPPIRWQVGGPDRPPVDRRQVINGLLYLTKTGCQWALLAKTFGCWQTVYGYFNRWSRTGVWHDLLQVLTRHERRRQGRHLAPSAGCVDTQSVKTATHGKTKGYDAAKRISGRKRHLLVDTLGLIIDVQVTPADVDDRIGLKRLLNTYFATGAKRLRKLWVDSGYRGQPIKTWVAGLKHSYKINLEVAPKMKTRFKVMPRRWVVERTFAWLLNFRRHTKNYERLTRNSEALIQIAMMHLLLKRIAAT